MGIVCVLMGKLLVNEIVMFRLIYTLVYFKVGKCLWMNGNEIRMFMHVLDVF